MSDLLSQNENYSSIVDTSVNSGSLASGVSEASLASALSASVPIVDNFGEAVALSAAQLKNGVLHQIVLKPGAGTGVLNLTRSASDIIKDLGFTQNGETAILKIVNFGIGGAGQDVQFNGTLVLEGEAAVDSTIGCVLLEVKDIDAKTLETPAVISAPLASAT